MCRSLLPHGPSVGVEVCCCVTTREQRTVGVLLCYRRSIHRAVDASCTGVFATIDGSAAFGLTNPGGAIAHNGKQIAYQLAGIGFIVGWNVAWTTIINCELPQAVPNGVSTLPCDTCVLP